MPLCSNPKIHNDASCHKKVAFSLYTEVICSTELDKFPGVPDPVPLITNFQTCSSAVQKT